MNYSMKIAAFVCAAALVSSGVGYLPQNAVLQLGAVTASAADDGVAESGSIGENITWVLDDEGTLTISGSGELTTTEKTTPWLNRTDIKKVVITDGVTSIGNDAFSGCSGITRVTMADSVIDIGDSAFLDCTSLESIDMSADLEYIDDDAFHDCTSLTSIELPDSIEKIGECVFTGCSSLTSVTLPPKIINIDEQLFERCTSLKSVKIPDGVRHIAFSAFEDCKSLTEITLPDSVRYIDEMTFYNCSSLKSIVIPDGVKRIASQCFKDCTQLESITIPDSVTDIAKNAFTGCVNVKICCHEGSAAEIYAKKYAIPYELLPSLAASLYPQVKTAVKAHKVGFKWTKVSGAEKYGIAVYQASKWKVVKQVDDSIDRWTSPQVANGKYKLVVLAKVDGQWVKADVFKKSFYVTVQ